MSPLWLVTPQYEFLYQSFSIPTLAGRVASTQAGPLDSALVSGHRSKGTLQNQNQIHYSNDTVIPYTTEVWVLPHEKGQRPPPLEAFFFYPALPQGTKGASRGRLARLLAATRPYSI